jgi:hypothetical protein
MLFQMHLSCNLILLLWVRNDFFILEHQPLALAIFAFDELIMRGCAAESTLLGAVGTSGVLLMLEIISDLVEAILCDRVFAV